MSNDKLIEQIQKSLDSMYGKGNMQNSGFMEFLHPRASEGSEGALQGGQFVGKGQESVPQIKLKPFDSSNVNLSNVDYNYFNDGLLAHKWGEDAFRNVLHSLTPDEVSALQLYNEHLFNVINIYLRHGGTIPPSTTQYINTLDNILLRSKTPTHLLGWRGMNSKKVWTDIDNIKYKSFTDKGYTTLSLLPNVAYNYIDNQKYGILAQIRIPEQFPGLYVESFSKNWEYEYVLPRGLTYQISQTDDDGKIKHLTLDIIGVQK